MKSSNCDTWIDEEAEVHAPTLDTCTNAGGGDGNSGEGGLPLKKPKGSAWDRVLGSVLVMFIGSGFRRDANFVNIGFVHLDLSNGDLKYGTEFDTAPFYNNTTKLVNELRAESIVLNNNAPTPVVNAIKDYCLTEKEKEENKAGADHKDNSSEERDCEITFLSLTCFCHQTAIQNVISTLQLDCCPHKANGKSPNLTEKELYLAGQPNLDSPEILKALNALVMFLGKTYAAIDESALPIIRRLSCVSFDESLSMDEATLDALGIFKLVQHPIVCSNGRAKEGSSLFGLVDRTRTGPGRCLLRRWLARPSQSLRVIGERQDAVEFLTEPSRVAFLSDARAALKAVVGLKHVAAAFLQHKANGNDWRSLINGMSASFDLGEAYEKAFGSENAASEMGEVGTVRRVGCALLDAGIAELSSQLSAIIDMEETERRGLGGTTLPAVKEGVDETLDSLRATYAGLGDVLDLLAGVELEALTAPWVTSLNAVYLPQVGFLVAIPVPHTEHGISSSGDDNDDNWMEGIDFEFLFKTHRAAYFKSPGCKEMDTRLGDVHGNMVDAEREVLRRLACVICAAAPGLVELADACIELDAVSSLALTAAENGWTRPVLTAEGKTFTIRGARNPLLEMCAPDKTCVRNTVDLSVVGVGGAVGDVGVGGGGGKVWFLTGPNSSGKSVYLSEIGLVIVLAQCGSFVPAEEAVLPVLDVVCCRGRPKESAVGKLSSFACECAQLAAALPTLTERSLLLLDEFGKGTDVDDGTALLGAAVAHLALLPEGKRPRAVVATHYLDALTLVEKRLGEELFKERVVPLCMEYFVGSNENSEFGDDSDVVFLYRVKEGVSGVSLAMQCARAVGLPAQVVDRAEQVAKAIADGVEIQKLMDDQDVVNEQKMRRVLQSFASLDTSSVDNVSEFISLVKSL